MSANHELIGPCGLYCGVCAIYIAGRDNNRKFKERLVTLYKGGIPGKGILPGSEHLTVDDIKCRGCQSDEIFIYCRQCPIRDCVKAKGFEGCHQCDDFPCEYVEKFPMTVGKKVILRAVPYWREVGTEKFVADEASRYVCPVCGHRLFRGVTRCHGCKTELDLD